MTSVDDGDGHTSQVVGLYYLGALDPQEEMAVEAHLAACPRCLAEYDAMGPLVENLDALGEHTAGRRAQDADDHDR